MKIAHIIHPVIVKPSSDLVAAQPVTFETMRIACEFTGFSKEAVDISLYAIQYHDERRIPLPGCFTRVPDLQRSVADIKTFKVRRKLALLKDILDALYSAAGDADYLIYTNVDIALQPYFYLTISKFIRQKFDAFVINRRTISQDYQSPGEIPMMFSKLGEKHPGWDCFVFKRSLYPAFELGTACIGTGWIGRVVITNLACFAERFKIFTDLHTTFHIGDDLSWKSGRFDDYLEHNKNQCRRILTDFDEKYGPLDRDRFPGRFFRLLERNLENNQ